MLSVALAAVVLFTLQALIVAAAAAARPRSNIYITIILVSVATAPAIVLGDRILFGRPLSAEGRIFLALMHLALGGFLFQFMTLPDRSVSLRILVELLLAPGRTLSIDALSARYGVRTMIASRIEQLEQGRFLSVAPDGAITLLNRGEWFGRFVTGGRRLFKISSAN
jgi:hypothetical protein